MAFILFKCQQQLVREGEVARIFTRQGHINQVSTTGETDLQGKAMIGLGSTQVEVAPRYILLTLFTLLNLFTLFILFKLLFTA